MAQATKEPTLVARPRERTGQSANRQLRERGQVPAVVYGQGVETKKLALAKNDIMPLLREGALNNVLVKLQVKDEEEPRNVLIKDVQTDPVEDYVTHVDFHQVRASDEVQVRIPVELVGQSPGVEFENGIVDQPLREIRIECRVEDLPTHIEVDIGELDIGDAVFVGDVDPPAGVTLMDHPERAVVTVQPPKEFELEPTPAAETEVIEETVEEAMEEVEEGELEEGEELPVEGEEGEEAEEEVPEEGEAPPAPPEE